MAISGCQHPLVEDILQRKLLSRKSKWALLWAILNFVIAIILYCDLNQGSVSRYFQGNPPFIWHVEFILAAVFTLNGTYDMWIYAWPVLGQSPLEVSPACKKLFSVKDNALPDSTASNVSLSWNYPHTSTPAPVLRKYQYQSATRSPQSAAACDDDPDSPSIHSGKLILNNFGEYQVILKLKTPPHRLIRWTSNFRRWIVKTILVKLASEIEAINDDTRRLGPAGIQIGEAILPALRQVDLTKGQHLLSLNRLIPYLANIPCYQTYLYLVQRLKDFARGADRWKSGGGLRDYRWNSKCGYKCMPWNDDLPTDCEILMHLFVAYMDSRLPPDPHYPDGKTFTSQYFKKTPDKYTSKDALGIYQSSVNPPHYRVIIGEDTWDFPKGHTNMFIAIFFFLHHIKTKQCGMLGGVNLGPSGIDILWVIET